MTDQLTVGSCFAGIGGIDLGLESVGCRTVWHSEIDPGASRVMAHRFPEAEPLGDITSLFDGFWEPTPVAIVAGGPPCQDISKANAFGRRGLAGARSGLFHHYVDLIGRLQPRWVVMEQVTGLLTSGDDWATVLACYQELGYAIQPVVVNSLTYVPQSRQRLILVGHRDPRAAAGAVLPLLEDGGRHIGEGRPGRRAPAAGPPSGSGTYRKSRRPQSVEDGETWVEADYVNTLTINDIGLSRATAIVVDRDGRPRILTPVEWERCHGFPDDWTLAAGSDQARWKCLGNAVTPAVAARVGEGIMAVEREGIPDEVAMAGATPG